VRPALLLVLSLALIAAGLVTFTPEFFSTANARDLGFSIKSFVNS
jgi:hypothetical protein